MNYAFTNGKILDGTKDMQVQTGLCILVHDGTITDIVPDATDLSSYKTIDLQGRYIMPGLINCHTHIYSGLARGLAITGNHPTNFLEVLEGTWWNIDRHLTLDGTRASPE